MADQTLLTIFIALTAVAVLIQTGILVGFYFLSAKLSRQADKAMDVTRNLLGPVQTVADNLQTVSASVAEIGASTGDTCVSSNSAAPPHGLRMKWDETTRGTRSTKPKNFLCFLCLLWFRPLFLVLYRLFRHGEELIDRLRLEIFA